VRGLCLCAVESTVLLTHSVLVPRCAQTYVLLRPHNIRSGSYSRRALFRFGNWCYEGEVRARGHVCGCLSAVRVCLCVCLCLFLCVRVL
jgi:hypothetical protein